MEKNPRYIYRVAFLSAFLCALAFALYTQHAWEDWYITYRSSRNLATGNGLVYNVGERVHSFTSVLGTLIPAALSFVTLNRSDDLVLWLFRILNCAVLGVSAVLLVKFTAKTFSFAVSTLLLVGVFVVDTKTLDFSINGMETAYQILALSWFLHLVSSHNIAALRVKLGFVWALLEYTRPDGVVHATLLSIGLLLFSKEKKETLKTLVISGVVGILLFSPWLVLSMAYYGSFVPHSIVAKGALTGYHLPEIWARTIDYLKSYVMLRAEVLDAVFTPPYCFWFNMPAFVGLGKILAMLASLVWFVPGVKPLGKISSFTVFCFLGYLTVFTPFIYPWYIPGATLLALVALASLADALLGLAKDKFRYASTLGWSLAGAFIACMLMLTLVSADQFRKMEAINERGQREKIGVWLKANSQSPHDTVFVECAGYIGFYSGLELYDFPGMTSDKMVRARKLLNTDDWLALMKYLSPDWIVIRPSEFRPLQARDRLFFETQYTLKNIFSTRDQIQQLRFKPYEGYFRMDSEFLVFRKTAS